MPIGDEAARWVARYLREARPALLGRRTSPRLFVNARGGGAGLTRMGFWKLLTAYGRQAGITARPQPARAAALVRDAPARSRRRPARDPDDARPRRSVDDADLHARARRAAARGLRALPSARRSAAAARKMGGCPGCRASLARSCCSPRRSSACRSACGRRAAPVAAAARLAGDRRCRVAMHLHTHALRRHRHPRGHRAPRRRAPG